nr:branched-chain amino acid ABC transporter permease [Clostridia bacterium]
MSEGLYITIERIIKLGALLGALALIVSYLIKFVMWLTRQKKQDAEIKAINEELTLLTYGLRACLTGLQKLGCDGPVTDAIDKIDKHINQKAHNQLE